MRWFRHYCLNGEVWDYATPFTKSLMAEETPMKCPQKENCGQRWEEIDTSMYGPKGPFEILKETEKEV